MDPIRPIGPLERDLEPVVRVTRTGPDGRREPREQPDRPPPRQRQPAPPDTAPAPESPDPPSLIDIKV